MSNASYLINQLDQSINSFENRVDGRVNSVYNASSNVHSTTIKIYEGIQKFKEDMMKGEQTQLAHENIMRIDQIIKEQFSNHEAIRKTVMGVVRDFDINLVRNSTIQELSEELWITSSRYWLSYALIAITAWINNYPEVARNALSESGRRDDIKTTLFFCLMNLRFERMDAAKKWFCEYMKVLDPTMLQQETAVLLQAFLNGIFGKDKELEHEVHSLIDQWIDELNADAAACEELVGAYKNYIDNLNPSVQFPYSALGEFCANCNELRVSYRDSAKFDQMVELLQSLDVEMERQDESNYKARVDAVLISLISKYDAEELSLRNQQSYYRYIVDNQGDMQAAEAQFEEEQELQNERFNIGKQMIHWAFYDDSEETDVHVRKFGLRNTRQWFRTALDRWDVQIQDRFPLNYNLKIDTWEGVSNGEDQPEQVTAMQNYFENNKFQNMFVNTPNIAAVIVFVLSIGLAFVTLYALVATVLAAGFLVWRVLKALKEYPLRVNAALANLNTCMEQIAEFRQTFTDNRKKKDDILRLLESI